MGGNSVRFSASLVILQGSCFPENIFILQAQIRKVDKIYFAGRSSVSNIRQQENLSPLVIDIRIVNFSITHTIE